MATQIFPTPTILRRKEVESRTGLSRSTIYQYVKAGTFPAPVALGGRAVGWSSLDIDRWVLKRLGQSGQEAAAEASTTLAHPSQAMEG